MHMSESGLTQKELPNIVSLLEHKLRGSPWAEQLLLWENVIFAALIVVIISLTAYFSTRRMKMVPSGLQNAVEALVSLLDEFVRGILGDRGRKYTPFIGTLFIYILFMNLFGLIPFMKSITSSWSTTLALALCVFVYVQYTAVRTLGFWRYIDHLMGNPRGGMAWSIVFPVLMFFLHMVSELVKPISLSLRLRSNIWGDDMLLAVLTGFGMKGIPLILFSFLLTIIASLVQAGVFCILTTICFAFIFEGQDEEHPKVSSQKKEVSHGL